MWNTFGRIKKNCRALKKDKNKNSISNVVIEKVYGALLLYIDNTIDSQLLDLEAYFHTITHHKSIGYYVVGNYVKMYLADRESLDIAGVSDIRLKMLNEYMWKI